MRREPMYTYKNYLLPSLIASFVCVFACIYLYQFIYNNNNNKNMVLNKKIMFVIFRCACSLYAST